MKNNPPLPEKQKAKLTALAVRINKAYGRLNKLRDELKIYKEKNPGIVPDFINADDLGTWLTLGTEKMKQINESARESRDICETCGEEVEWIYSCGCTSKYSLKAEEVEQ